MIQANNPQLTVHVRVSKPQPAKTLSPPPDYWSTDRYGPHGGGVYQRTTGSFPVLVPRCKALPAKYDVGTVLHHIPASATTTNILPAAPETYKQQQQLDSLAWISMAYTLEKNG